MMKNGINGQDTDNLPKARLRLTSKGWYFLWFQMYMSYENINQYWVGPYPTPEGAFFAHKHEIVRRLPFNRIKSIPIL